MPDVRTGWGNARIRPSPRAFLTRFASSAIVAVSLAIGSAQAGGPDLPQKALQDWEQKMVEYGRQTGEAFKRLEGQDERLNAQYYDGQWVFLRIAQYTGEKQPWTDFAKEAATIYERHMQENDARVMGYRKFPHGLYTEWKLNGDEKAREQLLRMRENSVFSDPTRESAKTWYEQRYSREVAYSLQTEVLAARAGAGNPQRSKRFADMALRHIEAWTQGDYVSGDKAQQFCKPFMAGLTASALISYYEHTAEFGNPDKRVPKAIRTLADWLWEEMWIANVEGTGYGAFKYVAPPQEGIGDSDPAPDLNQLIAPMYGWLYQHTGEAKYAKRGDAVFAGGVALADLHHGKRFNQNYRASFDYLMWRAAGNGGAAQDRPAGPTVAWSPSGS